MAMERGDRKVLSKSLIILLALVLLFILLILIADKKGSGIQNLASTITKQAIVNINGNHLIANVADTPLERERGLSGVRVLDDKSGMLFVFDDISEHGFWMRGMNIPLDIIWLDEVYQIVHIEENVSPNTYPKVFQPQTPTKYVLEVHAGYVAEKGIKEGDTVLVTDIQK